MTTPDDPDRNVITWKQLNTDPDLERPQPNPVDGDAQRIGRTLGLIVAGLAAAAITIGCLMLVAKLLVMLWVVLFR